jgi:lysozyme
VSAALGAAGAALIKSFESLRLTAYQDQRGVWTIAWGHTGPEVVEGLTCTTEQAENWFLEDTQFAVNGVNVSIDTNISQNQFDALVSFTYNVGVGSEAHSTLAKLVNAGDMAAAAAQFPLWDHVDGVANAGLLRRREAEQALFLKV